VAQLHALRRVARGHDMAAAWLGRRRLRFGSRRWDMRHRSAKPGREGCCEWGLGRIGMQGQKAFLG
jgi:hypothetical protein